MMAYPWDRPCIPAGYLKHLYQKNKWMGMELKILMINVNYFIKFYFLFFLLFVFTFVFFFWSNSKFPNVWGGMSYDARATWQASYHTGSEVYSMYAKYVWFVLVEIFQKKINFIS
jgi:hypothetical protein